MAGGVLCMRRTTPEFPGELIVLHTTHGAMLSRYSGRTRVALDGGNHSPSYGSAVLHHECHYKHAVSTNFAR